MKELDEIDQLFQTTFEGFELTPDTMVKTNIDRAITSKKKRRKFLFIWFPILLVTSVLASTVYFYSDSEKVVSKADYAQNQSPENIRTSVSFRNHENKKIHDAEIVKNTNPKKLIQQEDFKLKVTENKRTLVKTTFVNPSKNKVFPAENDRSSESKVSVITNESKSRNPEEIPVIAKTEAQTPIDPEPKTQEKQEQDSTIANIPSDSSITMVTNKPELLSEAKKAQPKWSLSILTGWENEQKKPSERFDSTQFSGTPEERARIQNTSFYGKIEFNRSLSTNLNAIVGLGFRSSKVTQYGTLYSLDSFVIYQGVSSVPPMDSFGYFIRKQNETRIYQVNSVIVPLGISYSVPLGKSFRLRISGGTEFAYSWMTEKKFAPNLSSPELNSFGCNVWLRPEIHYTFGKFQLVGFGTFNQPLLRQLNWDFPVHRNPAFGAGIGLLIPL